METIKNQVLGIIPQLSQYQQANLSSALEYLTEQEVYDAVYDLYSTKLAKVKEKEYWDKVHSESQYDWFTAEELLANILEKGKKEISGFDLSESDIEVYRLLSLYFSKDKRFEEEGYSLRKGIYLYGNIGCGKTTAMKLFRSNQHRGFGIVACREIANEFSSGGHEAIEQYAFNIKTLNKHAFYGQDTIGRCFDDIGVENTGSNFFCLERLQEIPES